MKEPTVVPSSATSGSIAAVDLSIPYSARIPGTTKPSDPAFMTSITSATVRIAICVQCALVSGASGGCVIDAAAACALGNCGRKPYAAAPMPNTINPMPIVMPVSIGMPASLKPVALPIQNIGRCSSVPPVTAAEPI